MYIMKAKYSFKHVYLFVLFFFFIANGYGQLIVNNYGSVSIGDGSPENRIRLKLSTTNHLGSVWHYGLTSNFSDMPSGNYVGISASTYRTTSFTGGRSYGVYGTAGNYSNGYNYGVYGRILGSNDGAGIYGTQTGDMKIIGKFAGFFNGNVNVTGVLSVNGVSVLTSDLRTKRNIKPLSETNNSLNGLLGLAPVSYNLNTDFAQTLSREQGDTIDANEMFIDPRLDDRIHRGFIAQELQEIFPDLVFEDGDGVLAINYIGLIPVIVDAMKEMQDLVNIQEERIGKLEKALYGGKDPIMGTKSQEDNTSAIMEENEQALLYQNQPNPFNQQIIIRSYIPEGVANASLHIYNMLGAEILNYQVKDRGNSSTHIESPELVPGMYLYALITDGKEVDTKRMILTE
jgi:hypothetical protein